MLKILKTLNMLKMLKMLKISSGAEHGLAYYRQIQMLCGMQALAQSILRRPFLCVSIVRSLLGQNCRRP